MSRQISSLVGSITSNYENEKKNYQSLLKSIRNIQENDRSSLSRHRNRRSIDNIVGSNFISSGEEYLGSSGNYTDTPRLNYESVLSDTNSLLVHSPEEEQSNSSLAIRESSLNLDSSSNQPNAFVLSDLGRKLEFSSRVDSVDKDNGNGEQGKTQPPISSFARLASMYQHKPIDQKFNTRVSSAEFSREGNFPGTISNSRNGRLDFSKVSTALLDNNEVVKEIERIQENFESIDGSFSNDFWHSYTYNTDVFNRESKIYF